MSLHIRNFTGTIKTYKFKILCENSPDRKKFSVCSWHKLLLDWSACGQQTRLRKWSNIRRKVITFNPSISISTAYAALSIICCATDSTVTDGRTKSDRLSANITSLSQSCLLPAGRSVQEEFMSGTEWDIHEYKNRRCPFTQKDNHWNYHTINVWTGIWYRVMSTTLSSHFLNTTFAAVTIAKISWVSISTVSLRSTVF